MLYARDQAILTSVIQIAEKLKLPAQNITSENEIYNTAINKLIEQLTI